MAALEQQLSDLVRQAFAAAFPAAADYAALTVTPSGAPEHGDYQCNAAMGLAKHLRQKPRDVAQAVVAALPPSALVACAEPAGPGFINLHLDTAGLARLVEDLDGDTRLGVPTPGAGRTVVLDYSSPNVAKPMHIGHIRSTVIGHALDRLHRHLGYRVIADNHVGDWGTQFGILIMGYRHYADADALARAPIEELERLYVLSYAQAQQDEHWLAQCRQELVKLQAGDPENLALWKRFVEASLTEFERLYRRLGVTFDLARGESYYHARLPGVLERLGRLGLVQASEGAQVVFLEEEKLAPCLIQKSDGAFNYATTDLATLFSRVEEFQPEAVIYVTDERQQLHFKQIFAIARRAGVQVRLAHVWFGLMRLPEGTFSTRQGNVIKLERLLDEAEARALAVVREVSPDMPEARQREVARAVGIGAVKYADLSQNPQSLVTFSWDKALALNGNSAPYLQYAYARIRSVEDKYAAQYPGRSPAATPLQLAEPSERALALHVARFPEAVLQAARLYRPSLLADYLYELAGLYNTFYQNVPFLKAPEGVRESRVRLCGLTARLLRQGLQLLGIETPERI